MARKKKPSGLKIPRSRSLSDFKRKRGFRTPKKVLVIVCEGKKTEPIYFRSIRNKLRIPTLSVKVIPDQGAPISIVERAIQEKSYISEGDDVWCVFDVERLGTNPTFADAISRAHGAKINLAITNPAFEYWFLLHFECTDRPFMDANHVIDQLHEYLPNYQKNIDVYEDIKDNTKTAIENAVKLRKRSVDSWREFPNPSTRVDKLVLEIFKLTR